MSTFLPLGGDITSVLADRQFPFSTAGTFILCDINGGKNVSFTTFIESCVNRFKISVEEIRNHVKKDFYTKKKQNKKTAATGKKYSVLIAGVKSIMILSKTKDIN